MGLGEGPPELEVGEDKDVGEKGLIPLGVPFGLDDK
jgi:hypothetical protein